MNQKKIAILTGGGDCPGLNAAIRGVTRRLLSNNYIVLGLLDGWAGLLEKRLVELNYATTSGIIHVG